MSVIITQTLQTNTKKTQQINHVLYNKETHMRQSYVSCLYNISHQNKNRCNPIYTIHRLVGNLANRFNITLLTLHDILFNLLTKLPIN